MKALIVDDEPLARRELRRLLAATPWLEVVGEAGSVGAARVLLAEREVDVVFLDVQMPGDDGFALLGDLEAVPRVVFTTASAAHAVRAFEVDAVDYLLKPIDPARLAAALARLPRPEQAAAGLERIFARGSSRGHVVALAEVRLLERDGDEVRLTWRELAPTVARSLGQLERQLDPARFVRVNRAQLVNLDFVDGVDELAGGRLAVRLRGGPTALASRREARRLRARLAR